MSSFILAYVAGLVTILSPCVLPMLPIVLGSALNTSRHGPLALASGLVLSFTTFGLVVATLGFTIGLTTGMLSKGAAVLMLVVGVVMLSTTLQTRIAVASEAALSGFSNKVASFSPQSLSGQFALGGLLGAVWTPCVGPTLGAAIALAAQGQHISYAASIMLLFALGTVTPLIGLMYGTREVVVARKNVLANVGKWVRPLLSFLLIAVGLMILTGLMTEWEAYVLEISPPWLIKFIYQF